MQNLIVSCIIIFSIIILYRYGAPYTLRYRVRHGLFRLFTGLKMETLAKKMNPEQFKNNPSSCCGCTKCLPPKENIHIVHIIKKNDTDQ